MCCMIKKSARRWFYQFLKSFQLLWCEQTIKHFKIITQGYFFTSRYITVFLMSGKNMGAGYSGK